MGYRGTYSEWLRNPAPVDRWFIQLCCIQQLLKLLLTMKAIGIKRDTTKYQHNPSKRGNLLKTMNKLAIADRL